MASPRMLPELSHKATLLKDSDLLRSLARQLTELQTLVNLRAFRRQPTATINVEPLVTQMEELAGRLDRAKLAAGPDPRKYAGHTLYEAVERAIDVGSHDAWIWLQAWWKAELEPGDTPPCA